MSEKVDLDRVRSEALAQIERSERSFKLAFFAAVVFEALLLAAFILLMERGNRVHQLLLIATVGSYSIVVLGSVALGAYLNRSVLRLLKAIELSKAR